MKSEEEEEQRRHDEISGGMLLSEDVLVSIFNHLSLKSHQQIQGRPKILGLFYAIRYQIYNTCLWRILNFESPSSSSSSSSREEIFRYTDDDPALSFVMPCSHSRTTFLDCCNGLLLCRPYRRFPIGYSYYICNPLTK